MKDIFIEQYRFVGDLTVSNNILENINCELTINTYDTNTMEVKVIPSQGSLLFVFDSLKHNAPIQIKSKEMRVEIILDVGMPSMEINSKTGYTATFVVYKCVIIDHLTDQFNPNKIHCSAHISHSSIFERKRSFTNHYTRGILAGWHEKKENDLHKDIWEKEEHSYKTNLGFLYIVPSFVFGEFKFDEKIEKAKFLFDQIYLFLVLKHKELDGVYIEDNFIKNLDDFLILLSFLEGEFIEWKSMAISYSCGAKLLKEKKIYRRTRNKFDSDKNENHYRRNHESYQYIINDLFISLQNQETETYDEIIRIITRFLIASTQKIFDTQLIYYHSCLDIIIKYYNASGRSFSHKLVDCCLRNSIQWLDLFPYVTIESLENKNEFLINKVRNDMLHHGIYPRDYKQVQMEMFRIRALIERLICKMLNVDCKNNGVGFAQY